ncbi:MAG: NADH-quinone oxidoreductase subunit M [Gammaproteobacteria bacterium]|nr:NADH-quinone oxidoreductase subunit M [Gammaproteobacteria bacterium]
MLNLLNILIWMPIIIGAIMLSSSKFLKPLMSKLLSIFSVMICLGIAVYLMLQFNVHQSEMQFQIDLPWISMLNIRYHLGVDGLSLILITLSIFTNVIVILSTWNSIQSRVTTYLSCFLILQGLLVGVFSAMDSILFYIFWEATLIPMYLIIGIWGSDRRIYAAIKFFLYTFLGSVLMLAALIYVAYQTGSFDIQAMYAAPLTLFAQNLIFFAFFLAFAIKIPMFPVHTWLPDAHTEAPAGGSIMLAAILLKLGGYGFLRFSLPMVPDACHFFAKSMVALSLIAVIYIGLIAIVQKDMKKLIAYSSISHMGFVTLGLFGIFLLPIDNTIQGASILLEGAVIIMISHAFVSSGMFAGVGYIYDRMHTRMIDDFGGIVHSMPRYSSFLMLFAMANAGLPGTSGFIGEFMVILGSMHINFWVAFLAASTLILGAAYTLWMYKRVIFGAVKNNHVAELKDLMSYEFISFLLLAVFVILLGVYPNWLFAYIHQSIHDVLMLAYKTKI